jgi:Rod binding domain-containing protein
MKVNPEARALSADISRRSNPIKPYEDIAEGMETSFTSHLLQQMRKTVPKEGADSPSMDYYNSLLDYERSQIMAKSESGLGVKKLILNQIVPENMKHYLKKPSVVTKSQPEISQGMTASTKENTHE